ncbi:MAG: GNAT family N-acetyltransferase [Candidatus Limnocylindrales bacterium]
MHTGRSIAPIPRAASRQSGPDEVLAARSPTAILIRRITPTDHDALRLFYATLSDESRRTRFLGSTNGIGDGQSTYFCCPDHDHREGFVATIDASGTSGASGTHGASGAVGASGTSEQIVGHICIEPDGPACAEVAVAVADELRGRGIGRRLVRTAIDWSRRDGFRTLTATMLAGNPPIQRLLTSLGLPTTARVLGAGVIEIRINLGPGGPAA